MTMPLQTGTILLQCFKISTPIAQYKKLRTFMYLKDHSYDRATWMSNEDMSVMQD